jgi:hypothetical protein
MGWERAEVRQQLVQFSLPQGLFGTGLCEIVLHHNVVWQDGSWEEKGLTCMGVYCRCSVAGLLAASSA